MSNENMINLVLVEGKIIEIERRVESKFLNFTISSIKIFEGKETEHRIKINVKEGDFNCKEGDRVIIEGSIASKRAEKKDGGAFYPQNIWAKKITRIGGGGQGINNQEHEPEANAFPF